MRIKAALVIAAIGAAAAGGFFLARDGHVYNSVLDEPKATVFHTAYTAGTAAQPVDFEKAAEAAVPSVVHIRTTTAAREVSGNGSPGQGQNPFGDMFGGEMFKRFFGEGNGRSFSIPGQRASGSGVIISSDGYIVTNNHVVEGASDITVTLNNRHNYKAKVIGTDPNTDMALVKIDAKDLPVINIGNSDDVKLGQWVMAIGYPLNLDVTVTQGIVSAKARNIGINTKATAPVESFIQTDAAVNPGSSGGALVNTNGELIAINSAIASPTGSFAGYAYAVPSNLMKKVIGDIMKYGSVQRGYLGISMAPEGLDDAKKKELGIKDYVSGVFVADVDAHGAAGEAGIKKGDVITHIDDAEINSDAQLSELIARHRPGDKVKLTYTRNGTTLTAIATLKSSLGSFASMGPTAIESLGADFTTLSKEDARRMGIDGGVRVMNIREGVLSNQTEMKPGFVIMKVSGTPVRSVQELTAALARQKSNFVLEGRYDENPEVYYYGINGLRK